MNNLTHFNAIGRGRMVDVSDKEVTTRIAIASGEIHMLTNTLEHMQKGKLKKGDVLAIADVAAIMGAKKTPDLIPMCHPLALDHIEVKCRLEGQTVKIEARVSARERTGVEMEALTAVSVAALTVFDMCKAIDPAMEIGPVQVERKTKDGQVSFDRSTLDGEG